MSIYIGAMKMCVHPKICIRIFIGAVAITMQISNQHACSRRVDLIRKSGCSYLGGCPVGVGAISCWVTELTMQLLGIFQNDIWTVTSWKFSSFRVFKSWKLANATIQNFFFLEIQFKYWSIHHWLQFKNEK